MSKAECCGTCTKWCAVCGKSGDVYADYIMTLQDGTHLGICDLCKPVFDRIAASPIQMIEQTSEVDR